MQIHIELIARTMGVRIIFGKSPETKKPIRTFKVYIQGVPVFGL